MKSRSNNAFLLYLKERGGWKLFLLLAAGILLLCASASAFSEGEGEGDTDGEKLAALCSSIEGVGECRVMITYVEQTGSFGSSERKSVGGITVLCRGADSVKVRYRLTEMLCSMYDLGANRIVIEKLNE